RGLCPQGLSTRYAGPSVAALLTACQVTVLPPKGFTQELFFEQRPLLLSGKGLVLSFSLCLPWPSFLPGLIPKPDLEFASGAFAVQNVILPASSFSSSADLNLQGSHAVTLIRLESQQAI